VFSTSDGDLKTSGFARVAVVGFDCSCLAHPLPGVRGDRSSALGVLPPVRHRLIRHCVMDGTLCNRRLPVLVLLFLCAAPPFVEAQQFVCSPIRRGDTASRLARRLTGNSAAAYSLAFQVRDPARQLFVPKSHYWRLSTHWEACVAVGPVKSTPVAYAPVGASAQPAVAPAEPAVETAGPAVALTDPVITTSAPLAIRSAHPAPALSDGSHDDFVFIASMASAALLMLLTYAAVDLRMPPPIPPLMRRAGEQFVVAFARPLIDPSSSVPPIEARLRFIRRTQQLEISIAPGAGRRYPNLVDHKRNVEYDVNRVMRVLGNHFVKSDCLRAAGKWVVVPIRMADVKQTGAK
jgi:hypothetical protein